MKNPHIAINDHGELLLIDAPDKSKYIPDYDNGGKYNRALASAIEGGVKFKDQQATFKILIASLFEVDVPVPDVHPESRFVLVNKGKTFSLPSGYTAEVKTEDASHVSWSLVRQVAILLPIDPVVDTPVEPKEQDISKQPYIRNWINAYAVKHGFVDWQDALDSGSISVEDDTACLIENFLKEHRTKL